MLNAGRNPARIIPLWQDFLDCALEEMPWDPATNPDSCVD